MLKKVIKQLLWCFPSSTVMMFHHCTEKPILKKSIILDTRKFKEFLGSFNNFDSLQNVIKRPRKKKIAITFDDGLSDVYSVAFPILKEKNIPFTIFVTVEEIGKPGYLTKNEISELLNSPLVTLGSHCVNHVKLKELKKNQQIFEIVDSKKKLESMFNVHVDYIAYPFGQNNHDTRNIVKKVYKNGFLASSLPCNVIANIRKAQIGRMGMDNGNFQNAMAFLKKKYQ